jgi:hypothetical protein
MATAKVIGRRQGGDSGGDSEGGREATATWLRARRWLVAGVINRVMMSLYIR